MKNIVRFKSATALVAVLFLAGCGAENFWEDLTDQIASVADAVKDIVHDVQHFGVGGADVEIKPGGSLEEPKIDVKVTVPWPGDPAIGETEVKDVPVHDLDEALENAKNG